MVQALSASVEDLNLWFLTRIRKFSYCLPHYADESNGRLLLGYEDEHKSSIQSTALLLNPSNSSFYYLTLHGITVGLSRLLTPKGMFKVRKDGGGGVIINSGTMFTALEQPAFGLLKDEFKSQLKLPFSDQMWRCLS
ncbi:putative nepenthesin [Dioscorea sansibarensis]